jgi:gluconate 2-dehydrogenase gamma chain
VQQKDKLMSASVINKISSFFDKNYQTPSWLSHKLSRRKLLKSAAGATAISAMPTFAFSQNEKDKLLGALTTDPWLTLNTVLEHLLPESNSGPSAKELHVVIYLYNVVYQQPTDENEIEFIYKGVGWLNGFTKNQLQKTFIELTTAEKETMLRGISGSTAGENWLNNLLGYVFEAMLSPPIYGGNPKGKGWEWLEHQAGFPLPKAGQRYFELPKRSVVSDKSSGNIIQSKDLLASNKSQKIKGSNKA